MTKEKLENYKKKLEHEKLLILREIADAQKPANFGDDIDHGEEKTDEVEDFSNNLGIENDLRKRIDEINDALLKIESGTYGVCDSCGKEIEENVLDIDPESRLCKSCKEKNLLANIL